MKAQAKRLVSESMNLSFGERSVIKAEPVSFFASRFVWVGPPAEARVWSRALKKKNSRVINHTNAGQDPITTRTQQPYLQSSLSLTH